MKLVVHTPAQAVPPGAKLSRLVSFDWKVMVTLMLVLALFVALAENLSVLPSCREVVPPGLRVIFAGKGDLGTDECPPQPPRTDNNPTPTPHNAIAHTRPPVLNLPMTPFSSPCAI